MLALIALAVIFVLVLSPNGVLIEIMLTAAPGSYDTYDKLIVFDIILIVALAKFLASVTLPILFATVLWCTVFVWRGPRRMKRPPPSANHE